MKNFSYYLYKKFLNKKIFHFQICIENALKGLNEIFRIQSFKKSFLNFDFISKFLNALKLQIKAPFNVLIEKNIFKL